MDEKLVDSKNTNYLMSIAEDKGKYSIAWVELTTGDFCVSSCTKAQVANEISRLNPKEILIPYKFSNDPIITNSKRYSLLELIIYTITTVA